MKVVLAATLIASMTLGACTRATAGVPEQGGPDHRTPDSSRIPHELHPMVRLQGGRDPSYDLTDRMRHFHVPGASIAVIDHDRIVWAKGFGYLSNAESSRVDTSTLFLAGSISKPVFATGVLKLVAEGKLALDSDVNDYLRSWKVPESRFTRTKKVTLRELLSHSAGMTVQNFPGYEVGTRLPTVPQILDGEKPANTPPVRSEAAPGARWRYSGGGYVIAQLVTTDLTGEPFPELMHRLVLAPAGMIHSTYLNPPPKADDRLLATGYHVADRPTRGGHHVYPEMSAAGLWSTPSDLARWAISISKAYDGKTGGVLSSDMARRMLTPQVDLSPPVDGPARTSSWGLGVAVNGHGNSLRFQHAGSDYGFLALMVMWPERQRGVVVMMNGRSVRLMEEIIRAFDAEYGLDFLPRIDKQVVRHTAPRLEGLPGRYGPGSGSDTTMVSVKKMGDRLWVQSTGHFADLFDPLLVEDDGTFLDLEDGSEYKFERPTGKPKAPAVTLVVKQPDPIGTTRMVFKRADSQVSDDAAGAEAGRARAQPGRAGGAGVESVPRLTPARRPSAGRR